MPFHDKYGLRYYTFTGLNNAGVKHAFFTRQGGVSPAPWQSLNFGALVGDDAANVAENYRRAYEVMGLDLKGKYDAWQVHSADVVVTTKPRPPEQAHIKADIILTNEPGVSLFMRFADCVPIMLYDPVHRAVGLVHAGWPGTVKHACKAAISAMREHYSSRPEDILAGIGPSISAEHYPIGEDVINQVREAFPVKADGLLPHYNSATHFDLWAANQADLEQAGVRKIETAGICTAANVADWYSHRAEHGLTGRFGAVIVI